MTYIQANKSQICPRCNIRVLPKMYYNTPDKSLRRNYPYECPECDCLWNFTKKHVRSNSRLWNWFSNLKDRLTWLK